MSALPSGPAIAAQMELVKTPKTRGFLHIARHDGGPTAVYVVSYRRVDENSQDVPVPVLAEAEGAQALIELLERVGVDLRLAEARGALADILRFGSATIPNLWLSDEEVIEKGLAEG